MSMKLIKSNVASLVAGAVIALFGASSTAIADGRLTPQDRMTTTIIDKSVISGSVEHDANGDLTFDAAGNVKFNYTGDIYSIETNSRTGELKELDQKIGTIEGQAAFPYSFVMMSAGMNAVMSGQMTMDQLMTMFGGMPPVVPWTCNHCKMVVGDSTYVSIVDALDPQYGSPELIAKFNAMLNGGAAGAVDSMRLDGRAFTGQTPVSFDPATKTMSLSMAGCSTVVGVSGTNAGMIGTLCLNSTTTFNVGGAIADQNFNIVSSIITAIGTSNCVTVLHRPTM